MINCALEIGGREVRGGRGGEGREEERRRGGERREEWKDRRKGRNKI